MPIMLAQYQETLKMPLVIPHLSFCEVSLNLAAGATHVLVSVSATKLLFLDLFQISADAACLMTLLSEAANLWHMYIPADTNVIVPFAVYGLPLQVVGDDLVIKNSGIGAPNLQISGWYHTYGT